MGKTVTYTVAVKKMARLPAGLDLFQASTILALLFNKTKETTADDLLRERDKILGFRR